jgi:hypothetical protein
MATRAVTNLTQLVAPGTGGPIATNEDGLYIEVFRVQGGTVGDTAAIVPRWITDIRSVSTMLFASDNLGTGANTNVTLTYAGSAATTVSFSTVIRGKRLQS